MQDVSLTAEDFPVHRTTALCLQFCYGVFQRKSGVAHRHLRTDGFDLFAFFILTLAKVQSAKVLVDLAGEGAVQTAHSCGQSNWTESECI